MKKSNIFLIAALMIACFWVVLIGVLAAKSINNYRAGKDPYYAHTGSQYLEKHKIKFPVPERELILSGDNASLNVKPGKELAIETDPRTWQFILTDLKNGRSEISFKRFNNYDYPVVVTIPAIPSVSMNRFARIGFERLDQKEMKIRFTRVLYVVMDSCRFSSLNLDFPWTAEIQDIVLMKNNRIDSLEMSIPGSGKIRFETTGIHLNRMSLSDKVKIEATSDIIKRLTPKQEKR
ncbi:MAG: hypothetical protein Q8867_10375 [Bacteroidota bacterium]|nr:hypothetical protein [Bacteroidota bacterium]